MRYILTIIALLFIGKAQAQDSPYGIDQSMGSANTMVFSKGAFGTKDGFWFIRYFADTADANLFTPSIKDIPGFVIRAGTNGTDFFVRNEALTAWVQINGGGGGTVTGANNGTTLSGANIQLGQTLGEAGDPAVLLHSTEIPLNNLKFIFRNGAFGASPDNAVKIDYTAGVPVTADGILNIRAQNFSEVLVKAIGSDPGFVHYAVENEMTPTLAASVGISYLSTASGVRIRNVFSNRVAQFFLGAQGNPFADSSFMIRTNSQGIQMLTDNAGWLEFRGAIAKNTNVYGRFEATTGFFSLGTGTTVADQRLTVANGQVRITGISNVGTPDSTLYIEDGIIKAGLSSASAVNIYNSNGTLSGTRTVTTTGQSISFTGSITNFSIDDAGASIALVTSNQISIAAPDVKLVQTPTRTRDTTNYKLLVRQTSDGEIFTTDWNSVTPTLQDVITAGPNLTGANTINFGATSLSFVGSGGSLSFEASGTQNPYILLQPNSTTLIGNSTNTDIQVADGYIQLRVTTGDIRATTITSGIIDTTNYKPMARHTSGNGELVQMNSWAQVSGGGSSGLTVGTTTISNSNTRSILYDSSGILKTNSLFTYNTSGELQLGSATDAGSFILQVTGASTFSAQMTVNNAVVANQYQTTGVGINGNFFTSATTNTSRTTSAPYLLPGGAGTGARVWVNGTTSSVQTAGDDYFQFIVGMGVITEATSGVAPRIGGAAILSPTITGGTATVDTLVGLYVQGPPTGVTAATATLGLEVNRGDVLFKYGGLTLGTAGKGITITEGTDGRLGQTTLVSGTKAITINGLTTSSRAFVTLVTPSGTTLTTTYQAVCTANTLTIQANIAAGTINTADGSTLNYFVFN